MVESRRVLIIDDEKDLCQILRKRFEKHSYEISTARDGLEGLEKVLSFQPHCIVLDIRIKQGEDGLTFLRKLRSYRDDDADKEAAVRRIPVIVLTAATQDMKSLFEVEGISDYVGKPFDFEDLEKRVVEVIAKAAQEQS